ncbi:MAG: DMT family transporter [Myxococcota bacterium]
MNEAPLTSEEKAERHRLGMRWAFASAIGVAFMVIPWKMATHAGEPGVAVLLLLGVAAAANSLLAIGQKLTGRISGASVRRIDLAVAALLAIFTLLGNHASALAAVELSPAVLNVLLRTDILFVALLGALLLGEKVDRPFWVGAAIAALGLVVSQGMPSEVALGESGVGESPKLSSMVMSGTGIAILAAGAFSGLSIVTRYFVHRINLVAVNAIRLWMAVLLWLLLNEWPLWSSIPTKQIGYAAVAAIAGPFLGRLCLMMSARYLEARVTTLVQLTAPALTLVLAFVMMGEWPSARELVGGLIIIAGVAVPLLPSRDPRRGGRARG